MKQPGIHTKKMMTQNSTAGFGVAKSRATPLLTFFNRWNWLFLTQENNKNPAKILQPTKNNQKTHEVPHA